MVKITIEAGEHRLSLEGPLPLDAALEVIQLWADAVEQPETDVIVRVTTALTIAAADLTAAIPPPSSPTS